MLKPYKRISKKELKEDKFVTFTLKARDYIEANAKKIMWGVVVVVVAIFAIYHLVKSKQQANIEANALLGKATFAMSQGRESDAESQLKQVVENYKGVPSAGQGCFLLAKYYWQKDDFVNAKIYFRQYLDDYSDDDLLTSGAYAGYADCLLKEGNTEEAAQNYEKAGRVDKKLPQVPSYLYSAAKTYMESNNFKKAKELATEIVEDYENNEYTGRAEILLHMIEFQV